MKTIIVKVNGNQIGYYVDEVLLEEGMRVTFNADPDITVKGNIYRVTFVTHEGVSRIHLVKEDTPSTNNSIVVTNGENQKGSSWYWSGTAWIKGQQKTALNQAPLFELYDQNSVAFSDDTYGVGNFVGNKLEKEIFKEKLLKFFVKRSETWEAGSCNKL
jgi:hypothetical protein